MLRSVRRISQYASHIKPRTPTFTPALSIRTMSHLFEDATPAEIKDAKVSELDLYYS